MEARSGATVISRTLSLADTAWTHAWLDLGPLSGQSVTISLGFGTGSALREAYVDEISVGDARQGVFPVWAPLISR